MGTPYQLLLSKASWRANCEAFIKKNYPYLGCISTHLINGLTYHLLKLCCHVLIRGEYPFLLLCGFHPQTLTEAKDPCGVSVGVLPECSPCWVLHQGTVGQILVLPTQCTIVEVPEAPCKLMSRLAFCYETPGDPIQGEMTHLCLYKQNIL